jgi:hypothetical protein
MCYAHPSMQRRRRHRSRIALAALFAACAAAAGACGSTRSDTAGRDAAGDEPFVFPSDASETQNASADAETDGESFDGAGARCPGGTYATAPSGAACDPRRIERSGSLEGPCLGPPVGTFCDRLIVTVRPEEVSSLPSGFVCGSPELGMVTCVWSFPDDASVHALDAAALEGACAATQAVSDATVSCVIHGS